MNAMMKILFCVVLVSLLGPAYGYAPDLPADFPELIITKTAEPAP